MVNCGVDTATEISRIGSYYLSHKNIAGLFGTGGTDTYACGFVSAQYWLATKGVIVAGFDLYPQCLGYIKSGDMTFTTNQQAYLQGLLRVQQMYLFFVPGRRVGPADTDTSHVYVTRENVDPAGEFACTVSSDTFWQGGMELSIGHHALAKLFNSGQEPPDHREF